MNAASMAQIFQALVVMLTALANNPQATPAELQQGIMKASQTIQLNYQIQAMAKIPFPIPRNKSNWMNIDDLATAPYLDTNGIYTQLGTGVALVEEDTSFGDLNGDGLDDAAVVVQKTDVSGHTTIALAAMLNQNSIPFDIADVTLGKNVKIFSHHVISGGTLVLDLQIDNNPRATYQYQLVGIQLMKI